MLLYGRFDLFTAACVMLFHFNPRGARLILVCMVSRLINTKIKTCTAPSTDKEHTLILTLVTMSVFKRKCAHCAPHRGGRFISTKGTCIAWESQILPLAVL